MAIPFSLLLAGFTAMAAQIILMREFLTVFYGNEASLGFILFGWLLWGAIGSWFLGRFADKARFKVSLFSLCQGLLGLLLPLSIIAIRAIKPILKVSAGEIIGFLPMVVSTFVLLAPLCGILGFMFSLGCRLYEDRYANPAAPAISGSGRIGKVYILEAVGSMAGGLLCSFALIRLFGPLHIMAFLGFLNISAALCLQLGLGNGRLKPILVKVFACLLVALISMQLLGAWDRLHQYSLKRQWQGYELLGSRNSIYGNISMAETGTQRSFFYNGLHLYTVPDKLTAEEAVHFCLLEHPWPEDVLLVGGGAGGLAEEALKHPLRQLDYLELDPQIVRMASEYLSPEYRLYLSDRRVKVRNLDGRLFIKRTDKKYDCIIVHLGDPYTAQLNRYYTVEFFKEAGRRLKEGGILSFSVSSSENYIGHELGDFLRSLYLSLAEVFPDVKVIPGDTACFLACSKKGVLTYDYKVLTERIGKRKIDIKYVREYYLFSKLSSERVAYMEENLRLKGRGSANYDFRPVSYYYDMVFWAGRFGNTCLKKALKAVTEKRIWAVVLVICGFILLSGLMGRKDKRLSQSAVLTAVMATGFSEIAFQMVVLLSFQIIYGFLFYKLGVILTSFMIGLTLGAFWAVRIMPGIKNDDRAFIRTQVNICLYPLILPLFFWWLSRVKAESISWLGSNIIFPFLPVVAGFIGGFQFPLANKICLAKKEAIGRTAGLSYGLDLAGSCLGALLTGAFLIPLLGISGTCLAVALINLAVLGLLLLKKL